MKYFSKDKILQFFRQKTILAVDLTLILGFILLGYFLFQNLYSPIINPPPPSQIQISKREEKINEELFNQIQKKLEEKKQEQNILEFSNPFD